MKKNYENRQKGFTFVEIIVSVAIFAILSVSVYGVFTSIINGIAYYREKTTISYLADQHLEIVRNMPYSQIGTIEGNPHGTLADLPNPINTEVNGINYQIYYAISYVDDPADGTILAGTDFAPNDYKQVKLYVKNVVSGTKNSFLTSVSPKGLEGLASGGALYLNVFDAVGQPISGATIQIKNTNIEPNINLTRMSDANGNWIEVGLPNSVNSYNVVVTKNGYSEDRTYPISPENPNPIKPDATISNGQVTQISFSIDKLSNLTFNTLNQACAPIAQVGLEVKGSKLIGTPNVLKFDRFYTSNYNGQVLLNNIEWDTYTPELTGTDYMIYGSSPVQSATILPDTSQDFTLILGPKTDNSLLTIVKDASTGNPIEGARVDLQSSTAPSNYTINSFAGQNGTISPLGLVHVSRGGSQEFEITPNSGYVIQDVSVDGSSLGPVSAYTFENVKANHAIFASFAPSGGWLSGWEYRKKITISNTNVDSDLNNFPLLIEIENDSNMSQALSTGYDIRFTDSSGNTLIPYERETWLGGGGFDVTADFWVKIPLISHSQPAEIYIYYGNSLANTDWTNEGNPTNSQLVWDSNFIGVWHMADNANNKIVKDSTKANNGTAFSNTSGKTTSGKVGEIGRALNFNGFLDYINLGSNVGNFGLSSNFTITAWVNSALDSTDDIIYGNTWNSYGYRLSVTSSRKAEFLLSKSSSKYKGIDSSVLNSGWHNVSGVWDTNNTKVFIDGAEDSNTIVAKGTVDSITTNENTKIGLDVSGFRYFKGTIDEVRVSNVVRSADWIKFEYHNVTDINNSLIFSGEETKINTYTITTTPTANGSITPSGAISVDIGTSQTFIITPSNGYYISSLKVDGNPVEISGTYTFNNVSSNHNISAVFERSIISGGYVTTGFTNGSIWIQQSWAGGSGQANFIDSTKYYEDNGGVNNNSIPDGLRLVNLGGFYVFSGSLTSSSFDTGATSTAYTTLNWLPTSQDPATEIKFQIAVNNDNETWEYLGPDGTDSTFYTVPGTTINNADNNRYIRYKVFLSTTDDSKTPVLTSVSINYVSGCASPGQVMFAGLDNNNNYQVTISLDGYQTQILGPLDIEGYNILEVLLSQ